MHATIQPMVTITQDPRIGFAERLNAALDDAGYPPEGKGRQQRLAKRFGVSQQAAGKWLRGDSLPELDRVVNLAMETGRTVEWLLTERGPEKVLKDADLVRIDAAGEVSVLQVKEGLGGDETRALLTHDPVSAYQVIRHDARIVLDVIAAALRPLGLEVTEKSYIDVKTGLHLTAQWRTQDSIGGHHMSKAVAPDLPWIGGRQTDVTRATKEKK